MNAAPMLPARPPASRDEVRRWGLRVAGAVAASALWLLSVVSIVVMSVVWAGDAKVALGWITQSVLTVGCAVLLARWWRRIHRDRPSQTGRPPQLDEASGPHVGLSGEVDRPTRWW